MHEEQATSDEKTTQAHPAGGSVVILLHGWHRREGVFLCIPSRRERTAASETGRQTRASQILLENGTSRIVGPRDRDKVTPKVSSDERIQA